MTPSRFPLYQSFDRQERATREVQELDAPASFKLVIGSFPETLFREVSHRYYQLDEDIFPDNLNSWNSSSLSMLETAALGLLEYIKFFPVLFFPYFGITLQFPPPEYNPTLGSKHAIDMSFDSVVCDYSQSKIRSLLYLTNDMPL
ncbi:uncharacterized protein EAE97_000605 [Botrytis byssoidea]|uniref:Uncharacterized protein n=1 Tax=Botrytis byssoidea TaxID=139641 RepID=A0A9P5LZM4_9HELO|nr:uncharacterized protein EAE97_000605 [Botrytis byssoidea]KAF7955346.1 hypothetical protein EAE97_000605 [Botrytis byssoidea]